MKSLTEKVRVSLTWVFVLVVLVILFLGTPVWEKWPILEELIFFGGTFLAGLGAMGRAWCSVFISGRKDGELVRQGPYALCRNPLYFFSFLGGLGVGLATETLTVPLLVLIFFLLYYPRVIHSEEKRLEQLFGETFCSYKQNTPCFFPHFSNLTASEPENYPVSTKTIRRSLFDALWFVWLIGIIELISALHEIKTLPSLFQLY